LTLCYWLCYFNGVKRTESEGNHFASTKTAMKTQSQHTPTFSKVFDGRKRRVRGLWERNGAYYAQMAVADPDTGLPKVRRVRLETDGQPVRTVAEAVKAMARLKVKREAPDFRLDPKRTPNFEEFSTRYLVNVEHVKRPATIRRERGSIRIMNQHLGALRIRAITSGVVNDYMVARRKAGVSPRGVNIEIVVLRNVLRMAAAEGYISSVPTVARLKEDRPTRRMLTWPQIESVADAARAVSPITGQQVSDFVKLMALSGGRWSETLRLRWCDVDFSREQVLFGSDGLAKNGESRAVDFNPRLKAHLLDMASRKAPDSQFLFPSRRRGERDVATITFNKTLRDARMKAHVPDFTCHLCRHFFASMCLMSKVDIHTVASWLGHKDNGVLLAKTYSHLLSDHKHAQAQQVSFEPRVISREEVA